MGKQILILLTNIIIMREKLNIIQKMTYAEYVNSKYPEMECDNFGYNHLMKAELERWIKYDPQVFVCNADPKFNYGLNFKVYLRYQLPDEKLWIFAPISFGSSSLTSAPFFTVDSVEFLNLDEDTLNKIASLGGEYLIRIGG